MSDQRSAAPEAPVFSAEKLSLARLLLERAGFDLGRLQIGRRNPSQVLCPLSFGQERLWFLHRLDPASPAYNVVLMLPLKAPASPELVRRAFEGVMDRHEILRTSFPAFDGGPVQRIASQASAVFSVAEMRDQPAGASERLLAEVAQRERSVPLDLEHGPVLRATLVTMPGPVDYLVLVLHHIVMDGWSAQVCARDFLVLHHDLTSGEVHPLPELPIQYADYALWQRTLYSDEALLEHWNYWRGKLSGQPELSLPLDRPRPDRMSFAGAVETVVIPAAQSEALRELSRREKVTLYTTMLAAFNVLLSQYSAGTDIVVGAPIADRDRPEVAQLIGFFVNMVVMRTDLAGTVTARDVLDRTRVTVLEAHAHQQMPFEKLVAGLAGSRDLSRNPLFQVTFALEQTPVFFSKDFPQAPLAAPGEQPTRFDLEVLIKHDGAELRVEVVYSTDLFDAATVRRMAAQYVELLETFTADLDRPIADSAPPPEATLTTVEFLSQLRALDVGLTLDGDRVRVNAPPGVLTPALKAELTRRKEAMLELLRPAGTARELPIVPVARDAELPVSLPQQRLWFLDRLDPGSSAYNISSAVRLQGALHREALSRAVDEVFRRHESLRTSFPTRDGEPAILITPTAPQGLEYVDLRPLPEAERARQMTGLLTATALRPFDLARGPLVRVILIQLDADQHLLIYAMHHIVSDGWSLVVFGREIHALYHAFAAGRPSPLPPLLIQYVDYARWQRDRAESEGFTAQVRYWTHHLRGRLPVLQLPTDRPRPAVQTFNGARSRLSIPAELTNALKQFSRREGATLYMTLLTAFKVLLYRYTGETDLIVGSPVANRTRPEVEDLIGFFVNTLVLRTDLSGNPTFRDLLARVRRGLLNGHANQDVPFDRLVEILSPERDTSHTPLFQVVFNSPTMPVETPGEGRDRSLELESGTSRFELMVEMFEEKDSKAPSQNLWYSTGLVLFFEYSTDLFDTETITRMQGHFVRLLEAAAASPDERIGLLPMLPESEARMIVETWNATTESSDHTRCIHQVIEAQAARTPGAVALTFEDSQWTYAALDARAARLARHLQRSGAAPGTLVGICLERSVDMLVAMLAVLKAGAAYLPLDPGFPDHRLGFMVTDAKIGVLVTTEALRDRLPSGGHAVVCLDLDREAIDRELAGPVVSGVTPRDLAYVIYTSGSTGKPKGVEIEHRSVVNFLESMQRTPGITPHDALLAVTTLSFDIAGLELLLPLTVGARIILASRATAADASALRTLLTTSGATLMQATPATWRLLIEGGWDGTPGLTVLSGGDVLPRELADQLLERAASLWNMYGPTEATIWSTLHAVAAGPGPVPIGRPIANTRVYILDAQQRPVPVGVAGELYIGGDGLARGYLDRPELTAERFLPDPFSKVPGARMYRTGDQARFRRDGAIEWLGRIDGQIKLRGFRIEIGEIESALGEHPGVRQAAVALKEPRPGDQRLMAFVVPRRGIQLGGVELQTFLKAHLPDYMVPSTYLLVDALPLTPNGKVDHKALPDPEAAAAAIRPFVSPRSETERMIAAVWADVLGVSQVGLHDNFFDLGGHSLLLVRVHSRIEKLVKTVPMLVEFFQYPTVATFAERLNQGPAAGSRTLERARERARKQLGA